MLFYKLLTYNDFQMLFSSVDGDDTEKSIIKANSLLRFGYAR